MDDLSEPNGITRVFIRERQEDQSQKKRCDDGRRSERERERSGERIGGEESRGEKERFILGGC